MAKRTRLQLLLAICLASTLSACATKAGEAVGKVFETVGFKKPEVEDLSRVPFLIPLRIHAGSNLNAGSGNTPLGLLIRIYKLKDANAFNAVPYDAFLDPAREKEAIGGDLLEVREVLLVPGQHYEVIEKLPRDAPYIGIVALFRTPAPQRWKLTFAAEDAQLSGVYIGALACALAVTAGRPVDGPGSGSPPARCE